MAERSPSNSTTDRSFFPQWRLLRTAFRGLELVAPARAGRWATTIWCTPPRARRRWLGDPTLPAGTRFTVPLPDPEPAGHTKRQHPPRSEYLPRRRHSTPAVVAEAWGEGPTVYLLHGWGGWRGQLTALVSPLVAAGHRVVALDAPGHGESGPGRLGGRRTTLMELSQALIAVARVAGPPHAVIAHSGGAVATSLAIRDGHLSPDRLVFVSPMARPMRYLAPFAAAVGLGERGVPHLTGNLAAAVGRPLADFDLPAWVGTVADLPPLLVVHDRADNRVDHQDGNALAQAWPDARLHTTSGLGHHRILADPEVVASAAAFITQPVPVGSGAPAAQESGRQQSA